MKAVKEGYEFSIKYPNDAALILIKSAPEINTALVKESQSWLSKEYQADAKSWGIQKGEVWKRYAQWLFDRKLIKNMINEHIVFTNEFLQ
jgi:ABC-type nitrate/sulfonate/bicarbonate transport system substrate-binding protein